MAGPEEQMGDNVESMMEGNGAAEPEGLSGGDDGGNDGVAANAENFQSGGAARKVKGGKRLSSGKYKMKDGKTYKMLEGSRAQVWHGTAHHTSGGLTKKDLVMNKAGRIVSKKKHATAKKSNPLKSRGLYAKKGTFGPNKTGKKSSKKSSKKSAKRSRKGKKSAKRSRRSRK